MQGRHCRGSTDSQESFLCLSGSSDCSEHMADTGDDDIATGDDTSGTAEGEEGITDETYEKVPEESSMKQESMFSAAFKKFSSLVSRPTTANTNKHPTKKIEQYCYKAFQSKSTQTEGSVTVQVQTELKTSFPSKQPTCSTPSSSPSPSSSSASLSSLAPSFPTHAYYYPTPWQEIHQNIQARHPFSYTDTVCGFKIATRLAE